MNSTGTLRLVAGSMSLVVLLHLPAAGAEAEGAKDTATQIQKLQQQRVKTLKRAVDMATMMYQQGTIDFKAVVAMQNDLLDAEFDAARTREERVKVLTSQLEIAKRLLEMTEVKFRHGVTRELDVLQARAAKLRVEIRLLQLRQPGRPNQPR